MNWSKTVHERMASYRRRGQKLTIKEVRGSDCCEWEHLMKYAVRGFDQNMEDTLKCLLVRKQKHNDGIFGPIQVCVRFRA